MAAIRNTYNNIHNMKPHFRNLQRKHLLAWDWEACLNFISFTTSERIGVPDNVYAFHYAAQEKGKVRPARVSPVQQNTVSLHLCNRTKLLSALKAPVRDFTNLA